MSKRQHSIRLFPQVAMDPNRPVIHLICRGLTKLVFVVLSRWLNILVILLIYLFDRERNEVNKSTYPVVLDLIYSRGVFVWIKEKDGKKTINIR